MKFMKKLVAVVLAVMLMVPSVMINAAEVTTPEATTPVASPSLTDISDADISISSFVYVGEMKAPKYHISYDGTLLKRNVDYKITGLTHKNCGTYTVKFVGIGKFTGVTTESYRITKANQNLSAKQYRNVSYKSVKVKNVTVTAKKGLGKGTAQVVVVKTKNKKYISVDPSTGNITVKKGAVKGTYRVKITYAGDKNHKAATTTVAVIVK